MLCLVIAVDQFIGAAAFLQGDVGPRVIDFLDDLVEEPFKHVTATDVDETAIAAVRVDVGDRMFLEIGGVVLGPLGRADQPRFLGVPSRVDHGPLRAPSFPCQCRYRLGFGKRCHHAGDRIRGAVIPAVMVIAANDPFIGIFAPPQTCDHVVGRHHVPVELRPHAHPRRARSEMIGNRKTAAPFGRYDLAIQCGQQWQRVALRDRQYRDFCDRRRIIAIETARVSRGAAPGRQHIARVCRHVHHRSALHAAFMFKRSFGIGVAGAITVVDRIGINNGRDCAFFSRELGLDAAPRAAVLGDRYLTPDIDAVLLENFIVFGDAVVDEHELAFGFAIDRECIVGSKQIVAHESARVFLERIFPERRRVLRRGKQFDFANPGRRQQDPVFSDFRVVTPGLEELCHVLGILLALG